MAIVTLSTSPTQIDAGSSYSVLVANTGSSPVELSRGGRLRPGQTQTVYPEGSALTAVSLSGAGQVTTTTVAGKPLPNPSDPSTLATDPAFTGTYVQKAPAPNGADDTTVVQTLLNAAKAAGGGVVRLQAAPRSAPYLTSGWSVPKDVALIGDEGTWVKLKPGANANVIQSEGFPAFSTAANTMSYLDGVPFGLRVENLRIDGNRGNNTSGRGLALWAGRYTVRNVYIYNCYGEGFYSNGIDGTTGGYPDGQIENIIENVWVNGCRGTGFAYYGPHDGYADRVYVYGDVFGAGLANAAELANIDVGYMHVYGGKQGVVISGNVRAKHIETENNAQEGLVTTSAGSITNAIERLTCYDNWTSSTTATNYSVKIPYRLDLGDAMVKVTNGSGVQVSGSNANGTKVRSLTVVGTSAASTIGVDISGNFLDLTANISQFPIGLQRFSSNSRYTLTGTNCSFTFYYEPDSNGSGNVIDVNYNATGSGQAPWTLPATPAANTYRLVSTNQVVSTFFKDADGFANSDANVLTTNQLSSGEATIPRWLAAGAVQLTSGLIRFVYFTAKKSETITKIRGFSSSTAAAATPTLCRMGLYTVAANGDLTLVASCASDTTMFAAANTTYQAALTSSYTKVAGQRYAIGYLVVSATTMPSIVCAAFNGSGTEMTSTTPRLASSLSGQTDLPSSITNASLGNSTQMLYASVTP